MKAINLLYETGVSQHAELCNAFPIFIKKNQCSIVLKNVTFFSA